MEGKNKDEWKKAFIVIEADPAALAEFGQENFLENVRALFSPHLNPDRVRIRDVYPLNQ